MATLVEAKLTDWGADPKCLRVRVAINPPGVAAWYTWRYHVPMHTFKGTWRWHREDNEQLYVISDNATTTLLTTLVLENEVLRNLMPHYCMVPE